MNIFPLTNILLSSYAVIGNRKKEHYAHFDASFVSTQKKERNRGKAVLFIAIRWGCFPRRQRDMIFHIQYTFPVQFFLP